MVGGARSAALRLDMLEGRVVPSTATIDAAQTVRTVNAGVLGTNVTPFDRLISRNVAFLQREGDTAGVAGYLRLVQARSMSLSDVAAATASSREFVTHAQAAVA